MPIVTDKYQAGLSSTQSHNILIDPSADDGTALLGFGTQDGGIVTQLMKFNADGTATLPATPAAGDNSKKLATTEYVDRQCGGAQTYQTVVRTSGTPYINNTGVTITLFVSCISGTSGVFINIGGRSFGALSGSAAGVASISTFPITDGTTYTITASGTNTYTCIELR